MAEYIDRIDFINKLEEISGCAKCAEECRDCEINAIKGMLRSIPAADVAPVVHAHWKKSKEGVCGDYLFVCGACGADYWESPSFYKQAHYCPNCGAAMDEEESHDR